MRAALTIPALFFLAACGSLFSQTAGNLTGQVFDSTQGAIPGATVSAELIGTGQKRQATTDGQGRYIIPTLPIGAYRVTAEPLLSKINIGGSHFGLLPA